MTRCNTNSWRYVDSQYIFYHWGSTYFSLFFRTFAFAKPFKISGDTFLEWRLLIVPFGIETGISIHTIILTHTFNRTIWNWNSVLLLLRLLLVTFNRTIWNWNTIGVLRITLRSSSFNRTIWNWNASGSGKIEFCIVLLIVPFGIETPLQ